MFACLYSLSAPLAALVKLAEDFTPRFEVVGPLVMLDVSGLSRLFGSPREIGEQLRRCAGAPLRIAIAPTQTAAALLVLGRPGLTVIAAGDQREALAPLSVTLLGEFDRLRIRGEAATSLTTKSVSRDPVQPPNVAEMEDVLPYFQSSLGRTSDAAAAPHRAPASGGWMHPRDSHAAAQTRRPRRAVTAPRDTEHAHAAGTVVQAALGPPHPHSALGTPHPYPALRTTESHSALRTAHSHSALRTPHSALRTEHAALDALQDTLRRWGVKTLGALAALPAGDVYERLGARGVLWQRLARGDDANPLVPWVPEDPFESSLDLEWPIDGLEPLSFVLSRLFEPLSERLERADRGVAILHTHLRLVDRTVHARTLQLPAPMRDPKTLRTLVLLDLESHPPPAAIDHVRVLAEPTAARVMQWALFERAQPSPEQVSTLLARLSALMGASHVGSPQLVESWKPGAFAMTPFQVQSVASNVQSAPDTAPGNAPADTAPSAEHADSPPNIAHAHSASAVARQTSQASVSETSPKRLDGRACLSTPDVHAARSTPHPPSLAQDPTRALARPRPNGLPTAEAGSALRRFRLPVPARVQVREGRPVKIITDRRGVSGGQVVQAAGPWRSSGDWWNDAAPYRSHWDRDEWDVAVSDGTVYRLYVERDIGQWFLEGVVD